MKNIANSLPLVETTLEQPCPAETSVVRRYPDSHAAMLQGKDNTSLLDWLRKTSLRGGVRTFPLLKHNDVEIHILDETSLMHTGTFKSIDGCLASARCYGMPALEGLLKEIDRGPVPPGSRVQCSLSGGASVADGKAQADHHVASLSDADHLFSGELPHG